METPSKPEIVKQLREIGISDGYAHDIAARNRTPSDKLAIRIFRETGLRFGVAVDANEADLATLERLKGLAA